MSQVPNVDQEYNPFEAPAVFGVATPNMEVGSPEYIRRELLSHEASIQSIGLLYLIGSIVTVIIGIVAFVPAVSQIETGAPGAEFAVLISLGVVLLGFFQGIVGVGLRRLRGWTKIPVGVLSGLGLLSFPIGTLINGYILYLVFSEKGSRVFSPEYQEIIRQTPHIKYQTSIIVKILAGILLFVIAMIIVGVLVAR